MPCTVHCLVSHQDELDPLIDRLAHAGIAGEQIRVVWRGTRPAGSGADAVVWLPWNVLLAPAAWWWCLAANSWMPGDDYAARAARVTALARGRRRPRRRDACED